MEMQPQFEKKYHMLEAKHWWFKARRDMVLKLLRTTKKDAKVIDIGCAGGTTLKFLTKNGFSNTSGIDLSSKAIKHCKSRGIKNVTCQDATKTTFKDNTFDTLVSSDVVQNIPDDSKALKEWHRIAKKGGRLILFTDAYQWLWSKHDESAHALRRYSLSQLKRKVKRAGWTIEKSSYWNMMLLPPIAIVRFLKNLANNKEGDDLDLPPRILNRLITAWMKTENSLLTHLNAPFGVNVMIVARKR
jgi:ubiquinone/menaquinone biosynthesis C-methylase UbiE|tara:strand:- start:174 stop:905 length:732 start_codon:yes stop_codon:yes gene_type:complete